MTSVDQKLPIIYGLACVVIHPKLKKLLLLKRSPDKKTFPNKWWVVGAYPFFEKVDMVQIAIREIKDELGRQGAVLKISSEITKIIFLEGRTVELILTPVLASIESENIIINNEHTEYKWIDLLDLDKFDLAEGINDIIQILDVQKYLNP